MVIAPELEIVKLHQLPEEDIEPLLEESHAQGMAFVEWLVDEYISGKNRYDQPGEGLFASYSGSQMIAVGGLSRDPYLPDLHAGRVRRVYVRSSWRRKGIGKLLVQRIIDEARLHYDLVTLRTYDARGDKFYRSLGFHADREHYGATHFMALTNQAHVSRARSGDDFLPAFA
ncbi:MAG: GNAT family N-acetyltransferase [Candidatus Promineifilaceae bacterium]|nr:GNAT family N-acetyltransferase [Candidatus Promineifilaceae bacterium]